MATRDSSHHLLPDPTYQGVNLGSSAFMCCATGLRPFLPWEAEFCATFLLFSVLEQVQNSYSPGCKRSPVGGAGCCSKRRSALWLIYCHIPVVSSLVSRQMRIVRSKLEANETSPRAPRRSLLYRLAYLASLFCHSLAIGFGWFPFPFCHWQWKKLKTPNKEAFHIFTGDLTSGRTLKIFGRKIKLSNDCVSTVRGSNVSQYQLLETKGENTLVLLKGLPWRHLVNHCENRMIELMGP